MSDNTIELNLKILIGTTSLRDAKLEKDRLLEFFKLNKKGVIHFADNPLAVIHYDLSKTEPLTLQDNTQNRFIKEMGSMRQGSLLYIEEILYTAKPELRPAAELPAVKSKIA